MIDWRIVIPIVLAALSIAACIAYLTAPPWPTQVAMSPPTLPIRAHDNIGARPPTVEEKAVAEFEAAADAILRKAPNSQASTVTEMPMPSPRIPLPRRRPTDAP